MNRYAIVPGRSWIRAEARSSLHPVRMETAGLQGFLEAEISGGEVRLGTAAHIDLAVELLKTDHSILDAELQRRLEARRYPRIEGDLRAVTALGGGRWRLQGELSLHGVRKSLEVEVGATERDGALELAGEKAIDMRDFGLQPPRLLFLRVEPQVRIRALLVARPG